MPDDAVLLVEDDDAIADALRTHLTQAGFQLTHARDGLAGLAAIESNEWALVLLDGMLPGMDGWDLCRHLRTRHPDVPVIMLSARSTEAHRVLGLELGADDYLIKPFSMLELVARVRALLRRVHTARQQAPDPAPLRFGQHRLDLTARRLFKGEQPVPITQREFDLLAFLARHAGQCFSRDALLQRVWGSDFEGFEHTVNSHINRLRGKIETDPRRPRHIVTVWGAGYRFESDLTPALDPALSAAPARRPAPAQPAAH